MYQIGSGQAYYTWLELFLVVDANVGGVEDKVFNFDADVEGVAESVVGGEYGD